jgi:transcription initiation factor TFIIIB Brf1 subunit/transcription initiation factor TFIIB
MIYSFVSFDLAATATVAEVKRFIREKIEEKKKKIRKPEIEGHAYIDKVLTELEILQQVMAEIYDIGRRKDLAKNTSRRRR